MHGFDKLPSVDRVLSAAGLEDVVAKVGRSWAKELVRATLDAARGAIREGQVGLTFDEVIAGVADRARGELGLGTHGVINATGIVLHTNLGRAPLSSAAARAVGESAGSAVSLELDLGSGKRGGRGGFAHHGLCQLTGAEAALVVNNCAAAVMLVLASLRPASSHAPYRVIVSRGELVEIGGGFRVPDVLRQSGAELLEVGTTNRTRTADYAAALDAHPDAVAILRVHQSNFKQVGFVHRPELRELAELSASRGVALVKDLGSGALVDLGEFGIVGEPTVASAVAAGCDLVCFSTDKALGGPQGGAIVGKKDHVQRAAKHPLARALRLGRLPMVALEHTLTAYLTGSHGTEIPVLRMLGASRSALGARAAGWADKLADAGVRTEPVELSSEIGGGALAAGEVASAGLAVLDVNPTTFADALRRHEPAIIGRIHEGRWMLDARTVVEGQEEALCAGLIAAHRQIASM